MCYTCIIIIMHCVIMKMANDFQLPQFMSDLACICIRFWKTIFYSLLMGILPYSIIKLSHRSPIFIIDCIYVCFSPFSSIHIPHKKHSYTLVGWFLPSWQAQRSKTNYVWSCFMRMRNIIDVDMSHKLYVGVVQWKKC